MFKAIMTAGALLLANVAWAHEAALLDDVSHALAHGGGTGVWLIAAAIIAAAGAVLCRKTRLAKSRSQRN